jgi:hypothetical protein
MTANKAQKLQGTDSSSPLQQAGILQHVLSFVGPGHWCFVAEVSSLWRDVYIRVEPTEMQLDTYRQMTCEPQMTLYSAVFSSPSRVRHAQALGLDYATAWCERAAGRYADVATLKAAHELGMAYTNFTMVCAAGRNQLTVVQFLREQGCPLSESLFRSAAGRGHIAMCIYLHAEQCPWDDITSNCAASRGGLDTLRWLRERGCPWSAYVVSMCVASSGSIDVMVYLQQQGIVFTARILRDMLCIAGAHKRLAAAKWLRQKGAEWPAVQRWPDLIVRSWSDDVLAWARAEGCTSPTGLTILHKSLGT